MAVWVRPKSFDESPCAAKGLGRRSSKILQLHPLRLGLAFGICIEGKGGKVRKPESENNNVLTTESLKTAFPKLRDAASWPVASPLNLFTF